MKRNITISIIFIAATTFSSWLIADIYKRVDDNGNVYFTNQRPTGKNKSSYKVYIKTPPQRRPRPGVVPVPAKSTNPARYHKYDAYIVEASQKFQIPEPFIRAVIRVESDYNSDVVSWAGAQGLMQLMPATAKRMGAENPFDPHQNILGGTKYLRYLANMFGGDMVLTIAGYHAGEGAVTKYGGVPPYEMTHSYIKKVLKFYNKYKDKHSDPDATEGTSIASSK